MSSEPAPEVSIVVTAHNEAAHIRRMLSSLSRQSGSFEVLLVDDRSEDATLAEARAAELDNLRILEAAPDMGIALTTRQQALDLGFRAARGQVIVTLDADGIAPPGWVAAMAAPILSGRADAVAGPVTFGGGGAGGLIARWQTCDAAYYLSMSSLISRAGLGGGVFFGNFAFRAGLYADIGGFAAIGPSVTEDLAFAQALQKAGARLRYADREVAVAVEACGSFSELVARTLRVTRAPFSPLAAVLTLVPLTLLIAAIWAALDLRGGSEALAIRYGAGALFAVWAVRRNSRSQAAVFALFYEPLVFVLAAVAAVARLRRGSGIEWGGRRYDEGSHAKPLARHDPKA
ncbi:MAG: glycosyltransferase [Pseudomonadota bacterium]